MSKSAKTIGIDCRFWGVTHAGLGRYTRELVYAILHMPSPYSYTLFFQKGEFKDDASWLKSARIVEVSIPHYSLSEQVRFWQIVDKANLDLMHFTHFNVPLLTKTPYIVTIHDLIKHFFRGREVTTRMLGLYWLKHLGYRITISQAIRRAKHIITPSLFTKDQIINTYHQKTEDISVIYEGVSSPYNIPAASHNNEPIIKKYAIKRPFIIYTGSAYPSKNIPCLLQAVKQVIEEGINLSLVIACARDVFWQRLQEQVKKLSLERYVILPGNIPDEDLTRLYHEARAFVMPSHMEGFGLPALEAMAAGCPVIASNAGSLPEVYGDGAAYFNTQRPEELSMLLKKYIAMNGLTRKKLILKGVERSKIFTWDKTALKTLETFTHCLTAR